MVKTQLIKSEYIAKTPGIRSGYAHIDGTRITVSDIVNDTQQGVTVDEIVAGYEGRITHAQVYAALSYYHDHMREVDEEIKLRADYEEEALADHISKGGESKESTLPEHINVEDYALSSEAANELGLKDSSSVRHLIADGQLEAIKWPPGTTARAVWLVNRKSLEALKETRQKKRDQGGVGRPPTG